MEGVVSLEFDNNSGKLVFMAVNKQKHDRVFAMIQAYIDKSWPEEEDQNYDDDDDEEEEEPETDEALPLFHQYIYVPRASVSDVMKHVVTLSNLTGITRVLCEPRDNSLKKTRLFTRFYVEGFDHSILR
jgi:hypothetical protein